MSTEESPAPVRMSRYRSVRRAASVAQSSAKSATPGIPAMSSMPLVSQQQLSGQGVVAPSSSPATSASNAAPQRAKTMSRYHNRGNAGGNHARAAQHQPQQQQQQQQQHSDAATMAHRPIATDSDFSQGKSVDSTQTPDSLIRTTIPSFPVPPTARDRTLAHVQQMPVAAFVAAQPDFGNYQRQSVTYQQPFYQVQTSYPQYQQYPQPQTQSPYITQAVVPQPIQYAIAMDPEAQALELLEQENARQQRMRQQQEEVREGRLKKQREKEEREAAKRREEELKKAEEERVKEEARQKLLQEERERKRREWEMEELKRSKAEEEKKKRAQERKQRMNIATSYNDVPVYQKSPNDSVITSPQVKEMEREREKKSLFKRWRADDERAPRPETSSGKTRRPKTSGGETIRDRDDRQLKLKLDSLAPQIDAPISAVNHGDRRVRVKLQGDSVLLPIKPTTTPLHLIRSASTFLDTKYDPRNTLLKEKFSKLGMERTLRMYEHVRDVLNSWDSDDQHELVLESYNSSKDTQLYATFAPTLKPSGGNWLMNLSQKPGKWDKRYIKLNSDGQITAAKNEAGKDSINVCNISDFEIFNLTKENERKKIRPPKKFCFAIKSMQKSTMFLGDVGFVHFFCSGDESLAQNFFNAVFRWRSWYLVNVMGEGATSSGSNLLGETGPLLSKHKRNVSQESQYILGSFNTGLGFDPSSFMLTEERPKTSGGKHERLPSDVPLAAAIPTPMGSDGLPSASEHSKAVHARALTLRRAAGQNHPPVALHNAKNQIAVEQPLPSPAASSLNRSGSTRSTRGRSSLEIPSSSSTSAGKSRKDTTTALRSPNLPPPLIDLTPKYVPPPQHTRKGRGFKPNSPLNGGLIDAATGPDVLPGVVVIPESREWRSRAGGVTSPNNPNAGFTRGETLLARSESTKIKTPTNGNGSGTGAGRGLIGNLDDNEGFTGRGLLGKRMK